MTKLWVRVDVKYPTHTCSNLYNSRGAAHAAYKRLVKLPGVEVSMRLVDPPYSREGQCP